MLEEKSLHASPGGAFLEEGFSSRGLGCVPASGCERCLVRLGSAWVPRPVLSPVGMELWA